MKVAELRERIKDADDELEVLVWNLDYIDWQPVTAVTIVPVETASSSAGVKIE